MSQKSSPTDKLKSAVGQGDKSNKHITKITAKSSNSSASTNTTATSSEKKSQTTKLNKTSKPTKKSKKSPKDHQNEKPIKEVFLLARPFVALARYIRDSWRELRQVRWPNRSTTWKMTGAVLVYCAIFMIFVLLLDTFFTFLFNLFINK